MDAVKSKRSFFITIRARLFTGFMALCLPLLLIILILQTRVSDVVQISDLIRKDNLTQLADEQTFESLALIDNWIVTNNPHNKLHFEDLWKEINDLRQIWTKSLAELGNQNLIDSWQKIQELFEPIYEQEFAIINSPRTPGDYEKLYKALDKIKPLQNKMINLLDGVYSPVARKRVGGLYTELTNEIGINVNRITSLISSVETTCYILFILAILLSITVPLSTLRGIAGPVDHAINIAQRIAAGERNIEIEIKSEDNLGKLLLALKTMQEAIKKNEEVLRNQEEESRELFEKLVNSSKKLSQHSSKVAAGDLRERLDINKEDILQDLGNDLNLMTEGLASITKKITKVSNDIVTMIETTLASANEQTESITSQASAINKISTSLEEIDKSSKQTMTKAQTLREVAKNTYEQGKLGTESVEQSINGIKASEEKMKIIAQTIFDLSNHMQQIGEITGVVNTLAQQSKMLALNASIEASKAGEAGKGFAAVATEVKNLAEQSEQSTVQVQKILEDIRRTTEKAVTVTEEGSKALDSGINLAEKTGEVIQTLSKMINEASISSQHIEVAICQESVGIEQIVESMNEINRTTSTFSSGIKELMTLINNLDEIAKHLKEDVNLYKV